MAGESFDVLLVPPPAQPFLDPAHWWASVGARRDPDAPSIDRAILAAVHADRIAWAFAVGYAEALIHLVPKLAPSTLAALAVTEAGGNHPRAIATTLTLRGQEWVLSGEKRWVTLGPQGGVFLVAAKVGEEQGRPALKVVVVPSDAPGVRVTPLDELPFVPEIPHASLSLQDVLVPAEAILPGDGYQRYVKPFRTIEDLFVNAAVGAYVLGHAGRSGWPEAWREQLYAAVLGLKAISESPPDAPNTHLALAGALTTLRALYETAEPWWEGEAKDRWQRDRALFQVAGRARGLRRERAWNVLRGTTTAPAGAQD
ncbi:MAG: acyl-CoA dehydrogenase family protein [Deltaproteobacteria bacterium]|nr:acyl-CoA dehydrogenase family protein [Deltaproteobacteria bacterium]